MILHDKLTCVYSVWHFSISSTQTRIEEDEPKAATREVTVEHTGIEVLKIDKNLLVIIRDEADSSHKDVCDGVCYAICHFSITIRNYVCKSTNISVMYQNNCKIYQKCKC